MRHVREDVGDGLVGARVRGRVHEVSGEEGPEGRPAPGEPYEDVAEDDAAYRGCGRTDIREEAVF